MNSARDLLRSYMEILSEAPAAPAPTPKAGLSQPPAAGAMRPTNPANSPKQMTTAPSAGPSTAQTSAATTGAGNVPPNSPKQMPSATAPGGQPPAPKGQMATAQDVDDGAFRRPAGTTAPVDTAGGGTVQQNKLTGMKTVSDETGSKTYDAGGNLVKTAEPSIGGMSKSTDVTTGDTTQSFNAGDVGVSSTQTAGGYEKERSSRYQMGDVGVDASKTAPNYAQGQLASPTTSTATTSTGQQGTAVSGVGFGGASGSNVGNNTVTSGNQELADIAKVAAPQPGQQAVQEEDTHEHPESARHLLKKLLKLLKDEEKVDEGGAAVGSDPRETINAFKKASPSQNQPKSDSQKSEAPKKSAENDKDDGEEKIAESLMHLYKAIKEGRIQ